MDITLTPIGRVESPLVRRSDGPKQGEEGSPRATLVFDAPFADGLKDIRPGDRLLLLTWLDRADREVLRVHPRGDAANPMLGVFSTRSPDRPNPIGVHRVRIVAVINSLRFEVEGLEALNGTPIMDLKPILDGAFEA